MSTTTTRLGLYKTASDGSELVNVVTDLLNNLDSIDLNIGYRDCTSSTRPSTVWKGLPIRESDTGRLYVSNGTAPASASWKQIPAEGASFLAAFTFASTLQVVGAATLNSTLAVTGATTLASTLAVTGATTLSSTLGVTGATNLNSTLAVTGAATLGSNLSVAGSAAVTGNQTIGGNLTVTGIGGVLFARKASDTSRASTTTYADDPDLLVSVAANAVYEVTALIIYSADSSADIKVGWAGPSGSTFQWTGQCLLTSDTGSQAPQITVDIQAIGDNGYAPGGAAAGNTTQLTLTVQGLFVTSGTSGQFKFRWAQSGSNATASIVRAGSYIRLSRFV